MDGINLCVCCRAGCRFVAGFVAGHNCLAWPLIPLFIRFFINIYIRNIVYGNENNEEMEENAGDKNKRSGFILKVFWRSLPDFVARFVAR